MGTTEQSQTPELKAQRLLSKKKQFTSEYIDQINDADWLKQSFMIQAGAVSAEEKINRTFTSAQFKFQDSSIGGHYVINPRAQFTPYADAPVRGFRADRGDLTIYSNNHNTGMGHYYSEAIDDTSQIIHMRFGVPQFNSLTTFFTGFFDNRAATAARTGRLHSSIGNMVGRVLGFLTMAIAWPIVLASYVGNLLRYFFDKPSSSFYYFKPTMPTYWLAVNRMVNQIGIRRGLFPGELKASESQFMGSTYKIDAGMMSNIAQMMPDVFTEKGGIDVLAISSRGQRMKNQLDHILNKVLSTGSGETPEDIYSAAIGYVKKSGTDTPRIAPGNRGVIENTVNSWLRAEIGKWEPGSNEKSDSVDFERSFKINTDGAKAPYPGGFADYLKAEFDDGSAFVTFRVNSTGPMTESFTNNVAPSDLASKFNSTSSANKAMYFSAAGGNIAGGNLVGDFVQGAINTVGEIMSGVAQSLNIGGLIALGGKAFVSIPNNWEDSVASLPKANYEISLVSPYGNVISQMTNIYIPLCMLLAGCLPLQAGKQAYTSPFLVQLYDRGRQQTRLGMIDSMTITRGTSNLGFNKDGNAMRIDVSFSVAELSPTLAMPIVNETFSSEVVAGLNPLTEVFDDENLYTDYLNVLSSVGLYDQLYTSAKLQIRLAEKNRRREMLFSKSRMAMFMRNLPVVSMLDVAFKGAQRDNTPNLRSGLFGGEKPPY